MYDYLIVGAGLFGAVFANEMSKQHKSCLVIDKRPHIGGNCYTENVDGIDVHKYGAHIFHTNKKEVWDYMNHYFNLKNYTHQVVADYCGVRFSLPFNMNTFNQMWYNVKTPEEAKEKIESQRLKIDNPRNLEEQALSLVGTDIYHVLIRDYTEKQWQKDCKELPASIIKRLPLRFTYDNNYFNDEYQGIPREGYTFGFARLLESVCVNVNQDFFKHREHFSKIAKKIVYTGPIDQYFDYKLGRLEYRSLEFKHKKLPIDNFQGAAVVNYTSHDEKFTRIIEHKHFNDRHVDGTVITKEYSKTWKPGLEPYYPINDEKNTKLYQEYLKLAEKEENVIFGGRLGTYKYLDMDKTLESALEAAKKEIALWNK